METTAGQDLGGTTPYPKPVLIGLGIFLTIVPIITVGLRFYVRRITHTRLGPDDWMILVALILCLGGGISNILAATIGGLGEHQPLGPHGELIHIPTLYNFEKVRYAHDILTTLNLGIIKLSVILFYRRLFPVRTFRIVSAAMMGLVSVWCFCFVMVMVVQCVPLYYMWEKFEIESAPNCIERLPFYEALAISDLIMDILVLALPIPMVVTLNLPWRRKIAVLDIFLLGAIVLGSGIGRTATFMLLIDEIEANPKRYLFDVTWYTAGAIFWVMAEDSIAVVGACLPTLAPLWKNKRGPTTGITSGTSKNSSAARTRKWTASKLDSVHGQGMTPDDLGLESASVRKLLFATGATDSERTIVNTKAQGNTVNDIPLSSVKKENGFGATRV